MNIMYIITQKRMENAAGIIHDVISVGMLHIQI